MKLLLSTLGLACWFIAAIFLIKLINHPSTSSFLFTALFVGGAKYFTWERKKYNRI